MIYIGCVITHDNFVHSMYGIASAIGILNTTERPRALNYMPLAHLFGCGTLVCIAYLGTIIN